MRARLVGILGGLIALIAVVLWVFDSYDIKLSPIIDKTIHVSLIILCVAFALALILWVLSALGVRLPFLEDKP